MVLDENLYMGSSGPANRKQGLALSIEKQSTLHRPWPEDKTHGSVKVWSEWMD